MELCSVGPVAETCAAQKVKYSLEEKAKTSQGAVFL